MAIADDLRIIAERANRDLDAIHDYVEHTKIVWVSFEYHVRLGHAVSLMNPATGTIVDEAGLVQLAPLYVRKYLLTLTFRQFIATFEAFFFDFLHRILQHNPWQFAKNRLEFETVLKANDRDEIIAGVLRKQLNELKYENVRDWFDALNKTVKLNCPTADEIDSLAEMKATRDLLEHNGGIANETYIRKAGTKARYAAGEQIEIDGDYHVASWQLVKKVVADLADTATAKLTTS